MTAAASPIVAAFSPSAIAAGGTSMLTISLPDAGVSPANQLTQAFTVRCPRA